IGGLTSSRQERHNEGHSQARSKSGRLVYPGKAPSHQARPPRWPRNHPHHHSLSAALRQDDAHALLAEPFHAYNANRWFSHTVRPRSSPHL
ncbi:hypothetical protein COCCADRAFT_109336, partial [Bipolaris zeicola 26-R-13]